jgi:hypothetical protein
LEQHVSFKKFGDDDLYLILELSVLDLFILFSWVPPELFLIKGFLNFTLGILVKFFTALKLDLLINTPSEFCRKNHHPKNEKKNKGN